MTSSWITGHSGCVAAAAPRLVAGAAPPIRRKRPPDAQLRRNDRSRAWLSHVRARWATATARRYRGLPPLPQPAVHRGRRSPRPREPACSLPRRTRTRQGRAARGPGGQTLARRGPGAACQPQARRGGDAAGLACKDYPHRNLSSVATSCPMERALHRTDSRIRWLRCWYLPRISMWVILTSATDSVAASGSTRAPLGCAHS